MLHSTKFLSFVKKRRYSFANINTPFNPKEPWRIRPRQSANNLSYYSVALAQSKEKIHKPKNLPQLENFVVSMPLFRNNLTVNSHLKATRALNWIRLVYDYAGQISCLKLKYKGKSFRWHRKLKSVLLRFGHSHLVIKSPIKTVKWRKHGRQKMIFWGTNKWYLLQFLQRLIKWRPMNVYHGRGLRLGPQKVLRKSGKVSIYR